MSSAGRHAASRPGEAAHEPRDSGPDVQPDPRPGDPETRRRILDAALELLVAGRGSRVTLSDVARRADVSRQAIYLHFGGRADLLVAVARRADELRGLPAAIRRIEEASSGSEAVRELVALQARMNPDIWPVALALEEVRRRDEAAERAWQDRLEGRLAGCRAIVARLTREGARLEGIGQEVAADLLWTLTSLRTWEDLVLQRQWSPRRYRAQVTRVALLALTGKPG
jgi:AcrR family transcriptional regulator